MCRCLRIKRRLAGLPPRTVVCCEAHVPGGRTGDLPAAWRRGHGWHLTPFALLLAGGQNSRTWTFDRVSEWLARHDLRTPIVSPVTDEWTAPQMLEYVRRERLEGLMLKDTHLSGWMKFKPVQTLDVVAMRVAEGRSKYAGMMGAYVVGLYLHDSLEQVGHVGGGWSDEDRRAHWARPRIGAVMEVAVERLAASGGLLFPRFLRWREDKPAELCVMDQLEELR
jgi:ATP-dependent DNA ligase